MNLLTITWRNIQQRGLSSVLTGFSMALGVALVVAVLVILGVVRQQFGQDAQGYHLIVGAKGDKLQLVLNTVFHLSRPVENIPYSYYQEFTDGKFATQTKVAVPLCMGDSFQKNGNSYRVVGTSVDLFDKLSYGRDKNGDIHYRFQEGGRNFNKDAFFEAVIGSVVASQSGLKVGDQFSPTHGITEDGAVHDHDSFTIVGVLEPTGTANDRALFVNIEGFYLLDGHSKTGGQTDEPTEAIASEAESHEHREEDRDHNESSAHEEEHAQEESHDGEDKDAHADEKHEGEEHKGEEHDDGEHAHNEAADSHDEDHDGAAHDAEHHPTAGADVKHKDDTDSHDEEAGDHESHDHSVKPLPISEREVTSVLLWLNDDFYSEGIRNKINEGPFAQAVAPIREVTVLFNTFVRPFEIMLQVLTAMIVVVASISILVGIYNSMSERLRDIAVMRALGASRGTVMTIVMLESILLAICGGLAGWILGHLLVGLASPYVESQTGVMLHVLNFQMAELMLIPALVVLAALVGLLPALVAYRTDVSKALSAAP